MVVVVSVVLRIVDDIVGVVLSSFGIVLPGPSVFILASGESEALSTLVPFQRIAFLIASK